MPLEALPRDQLERLPPLLSHGDLALVESNEDGSMKQVTLILLVRAKPETLYQILSHPLEYAKFVPNVSRSRWEPRENGGVYSWRLELPVSSFENAHVYELEPEVVRVHALAEKDDATYRWELLPVPSGTVLVQYGYTDVKGSNALVRSFVKRMPVTEHGLALAAQLMLAAAVKREAERRTPAGAVEPVDKSAASPGFGFLLARGQVAVMRSLPDGRLGDISLIDRVYAPVEKVRAAIADMASWSRWVPGVKESQRRSDGAVRVDFAIPLVTWSTAWALRAEPRAVDGLGVEGDLRGARFRWDLTPRGPKETLVVYRVSQRLGQSSTLFRALIERDLTLEHGLNVAFSLVYLRAVRGHAEGWGP